MIERSGRLAIFGVMLLLGVSLLVLQGLRPSESVGPCTVASGPATLPDIPETSGLAVSRRDPGLLWSHNDSGNAAELFGLDLTGTVRQRVRVPIKTRDWEDISAARCQLNDCLYIADIGDNSQARRQIRIHRVAEPAPGETEAAPPESFNGTYADGPHNAEAMFVIGEDFFIITRDRTGGVYRSTHLGRNELSFRRIGQLGLGSVTDAEASSDEKTVVVRTSHQFALYRTDDLIAGRDAPYVRIPIDGLKEAQGEGVALDGGMVYLSSEGKPWNRAGRLMSLRCQWPE